MKASAGPISDAVTGMTNVASTGCHYAIVPDEENDRYFISFEFTLDVAKNDYTDGNPRTIGTIYFKVLGNSVSSLNSSSIRLASAADLGYRVNDENRAVIDDSLTPKISRLLAYVVASIEFQKSTAGSSEQIVGKSFEFIPPLTVVPNSTSFPNEQKIENPSEATAENWRVGIEYDNCDVAATTMLNVVPNGTREIDIPNTDEKTTSVTYTIEAEDEAGAHYTSTPSAADDTLLEATGLSWEFCSESGGPVTEGDELVGVELATETIGGLEVTNGNLVISPEASRNPADDSGNVMVYLRASRGMYYMGESGESGGRVVAFTLKKGELEPTSLQIADAQGETGSGEMLVNGQGSDFLSKGAAYTVKLLDQYGYAIAGDYEGQISFSLESSNSTGLTQAKVDELFVLDPLLRHGTMPQRKTAFLLP